MFPLRAAVKTVETMNKRIHINNALAAHAVNAKSCWKGSTPPKIPKQLLADMHIAREEENALKITEEATHARREEHDIPGIDSLLELMQAEEIQKRGRSDTVSTVLSDSYD